MHDELEVLLDTVDDEVEVQLIVIVDELDEVDDILDDFDDMDHVEIQDEMHTEILEEMQAGMGQVQ